MAQKIDDKLVREHELPLQKLVKGELRDSSAITYDTQVKGFGLRVTTKGAKAFILNYRIGRLERRYTIGSYPDWSVAAARTEAGNLKKRIDRGEDPMAERHEVRTAPTVKELAQRYREEHLPRKRSSSRAEDESMLDNIIVPKLGTKAVADVQYADVEKVHRELRDRPYRANRTLALLSKMFTLSIKWRMRGDNPAKGVERFDEQRRERFLSQKEIAKVGEALAAYPTKTPVNAIRFLLLTGARRGEVLNATWSQFDLDAGVWIKPSSHTKTKRAHRVPLSAPAKQLLVEIMKEAKPETEDAPVFPGRKKGSAFRELNKAWTTIRKTAGIPDVRIHDLRHTYASILASSGLSLPIIGALLGHTQPATTQRYAHLFDDPLREATERVGAVVGAAGNGEAEVVQIEKHRKTSA